MDPTLESIKQAHQRLKPFVLTTPCWHAPVLSQRMGVDLVLKLENLQRTASFKERGVVSKLQRFMHEKSLKGVVAMSAGNHAQAVAYHAHRLGLPSCIVMPLTTPNIKVSKTKAYGGDVLLHGHTVAEAGALARSLAHEKQYLFLHPFEDPDVVSGQATVFLDVIEQAPDLEVLVVPVGGGGLISGIALAAKALKPELRIIGVQAQAYSPLVRRLKNLPPFPQQHTIAEGIAVKEPGEMTERIIQHNVDDMVTVKESSIEWSVVRLACEEKIVSEGAAAATLAAVYEHPSLFAGKKVGLIISGGNIDQRLLATLLMRDLAREGRLARYIVQLYDVSGQLGKVATLFAENKGNLVDVVHERLSPAIGPAYTLLNLVAEVENKESARRIFEALSREGYQAQWLQDEGGGEGACYQTTDFKKG